MQKFQCLLFLLKQKYICYYIICMTVPLSKTLISSDSAEACQDALIGKG